MDENDVKYQISQIKLQRIQELNIKLKQSLLRERIPTSEASLSVINYTLETPDFLIPLLWKLPPEQNQYQKFQIYKSTRKLRVHNKSNCCTIT